MHIKLADQRCLIGLLLGASVAASAMAVETDDSPVDNCPPVLALLALLAQGRRGSVVVDYLDTLRLGIEACGIA